MEKHYFNFRSTDEEKRKLRVDIGRLAYRLKYQKHKSQEAEDKAKEWQKKYEEQQKEIEKLKEENEKLKRQRDTYRDMLFKANKKLEDTEEQGAVFQS